MKKITITVVFILALLFSATGCNKAVTQNVEQGKITPSYLTGDYAKKLEKDGAKKYSGMITEATLLSGSAGKITLVEMKDGKEEKPKELSLDPKVQIVYITNSSPEGAIMTGKEFIKAFVPETNNSFQVFTKDDKVVLLFSTGK